MTKRIFRAICLAALGVFLASMVLIMGVLYNYFSNVQREQLRMQAALAVQGVSHEGAAYFEDLRVTDYRLTWIGEDGTVRYDSQSGTTENHLEREEVIEALSEGYGESTRYSSTLMERSFYTAQRLPDGTVLRLSISQRSILTLLLGMVQPILMVFVVAAVLSVLLAVRISRKIIAPLNDLDLDNPLNNQEYDEISPLLRRIDKQQAQLQAQAAALRQKQNELSTIVGSMNEGMILLNQEEKVLSINPAAMALLGATEQCVGADMLTVSRNLDLQQLLEQALGGQPATRTTTLQGRIYQIDANPVRSEGQIAGAALFFFDITEQAQAEQLRREFTANVSHELKTPLHAISGYAELLHHGMVKPADIQPFAGKIYSETQRLIRLVEDIISLSHLDEGAGDMQWEETDLYTLAEETVRSLTPAAEADQVTLELSGQPAVFRGIPQLLHSIVYNLCDNAIKYNRPGGHVSVDVQNEAGSVVLTVTDTGIGIAPEHQTRIFERFYRVDKSHSKEVGGTGLGLSIVKHAAKIHGAAISIQSAHQAGTTIAVRFPTDSAKRQSNSL